MHITVYDAMFTLHWIVMGNFNLKRSCVNTQLLNNEKLMNLLVS